MSDEALVAILRQAPVIPVLTIERVEDAVPLGRALVAGGLPVLEVTMRTPAALEAIAALSEHVPEALVGVGTLLSSEDVVAAQDSGALFGVSPGATPELIDTTQRRRLPFLPGVATASEAMAMLSRGMRIMKLFPASVVGGIPALKALGAPLADISFCPTGGIGEADFVDYLKLPNVICVGGSWVAPADAIRAGDWKRIELLARAARSKAQAAGWRAG